MFSYYVPGGRPGTITSELAYAFFDAPEPSNVVCCETHAGPDDASGCYYALGESPSTARKDYQRATLSETWFACDVGEHGPDSLMRSQQLPGQSIELNDGNHWMIPTARSFTIENGELLSTMELPRILTMLPDGSMGAGSVIRRYADYWDRASELWDIYGERDVTFEEGFRFAVAALSVNYRVWLSEVSALELLTQLNVPAILDVMIDMKTYGELADEFLKKKDAALATSSSRDGEPDAIPTTLQPTQT